MRRGHPRPKARADPQRGRGTSSGSAGGTRLDVGDRESRAPRGGRGGVAQTLETWDACLVTKAVRTGFVSYSHTDAALVDRFAQLREELSLNGVAAELNPGGLLPLPQETRSLQILTRDVLPALR